MTGDELEKIEIAEFEDAMRSLLGTPGTDFERVVVPWLAQLRDFQAVGPVTPEFLPTHNFYLGQRSLIEGFYDAIERINPNAAHRLTQEAAEYARRRNNVD